MEYYYNSTAADSLQELILDQLPDDANVVDTADWSDDNRKAFYNDRLVALSAKTKKSLRGRVKTHKAGTIHFTDGLLLAGGDFYVGEEALEPLGIEIASADDFTVDEDQLADDRDSVTIKECQEIREAGVPFVQGQSVEDVAAELGLAERDARRRIQQYVLAATEKPDGIRYGSAMAADDFYIRPLTASSPEAILSETPSDSAAGEERSEQEYIREYTGSLLRQFDAAIVTLNEDARDDVRAAVDDYESGTSASGLGGMLDEIATVNAALQRYGDFAGVVGEVTGFIETAQKANEAAVQLGGVPDQVSVPSAALAGNDPSMEDVSVSPEAGAPSRAELEARVKQLEQRVAALEAQLDE